MNVFQDIFLFTLGCFCLLFQLMQNFSVLSRVLENLCFPFPLERHQGSYLHPFHHPSPGFFCFHPFPSLSSILHSRVSPHLSPNIIFPALWRTHQPGRAYGEEQKTICAVLNWKDLKGAKGQLLLLQSNYKIIASPVNFLSIQNPTLFWKPSFCSFLLQSLARLALMPRTCCESLEANSSKSYFQNRKMPLH